MNSKREKSGRKAVIIGFSGNSILAILNFTVGTISGSTALIVESAHTFSDIVTTIIAFIGFKIGLKPADKEHPYGHGRAEPIVGLVIVIFLLFISYEVFSEVYYKLTLGPALTPPSLLAAVMALVGIIINYTMTHYLMGIGKNINSPAIMADANHQKVDIFACAGVFVGVIGSNLGFPILDPLVGGFVGLLILRIAFNVAKDNINNLMGKIPSDKIVEDIISAAESVEGVHDAHGVKVNYLGPYASVELHINVSGELSVKKAHEIAQSVQKSITDKVDIINSALVHVCPIEEDKCYV